MTEDQLADHYARQRAQHDQDVADAAEQRRLHKLLNADQKAFLREIGLLPKANPES